MGQGGGPEWNGPPFTVSASHRETRSAWKRNSGILTCVRVWIASALAVAFALSACGGASSNALPSDGTTWEVDQSAPPPRATSQRIPVLVYATHCASGKPPSANRVHEPTVAYQDDAITATYLVDAPPGLHTCPGSPPARTELILNEPLGDRVLIDGARPEGRQQVWPPEK